MSDERETGPGEPRSKTEQGSFDRLYAELRSMAHARYGRISDRKTLQPTVLVHEAWVRLAAGKGEFRSRAHFMASAAVAMRCVLADHARSARVRRRDTSADEEVLNEVEVAGTDYKLLAVHEALEKLRSSDPRKAEIATLRFLLGCSVEETAESLELSRATVKREWMFARAWLHRELEVADE